MVQWVKELCITISLDNTVYVPVFYVTNPFDSTPSSPEASNLLV